MGRWSRQIANLFIAWLAPAPRSHWLELGCGTGALTQAICELSQPSSLAACDPSPEFVAYARSSVSGCAATFFTADSETLPDREGDFGFAVSGLVLNFLPQPLRSLLSMREKLQVGGVLAAYVWDYQDGMELLRVFWEEAVALDPAAGHLAERHRFPMSQPKPLTDLFHQAGLASIDVKPLEISMVFNDFDAYWSPFLGGTGPAPAYVHSLSPEARSQLKDRLNLRNSPSSDGLIHLSARAFAIQGIVPDQGVELNRSGT
jgi:SAM-dependent methyltransferase